MLLFMIQTKSEWVYVYYLIHCPYDDSSRATQTCQKKSNYKLEPVLNCTECFVIGIHLSSRSSIVLLMTSVSLLSFLPSYFLSSLPFLIFFLLFSFSLLFNFFCAPFFQSSICFSPFPSDHQVCYSSIEVTGIISSAGMVVQCPR